MYTSYNSKFGKDITTIHPGEYFISGDVIIHTLLGTCVSVVLYSEQDRIGGLNHYMLPSSDSAPEHSLMDGAGRYGVHAMELLINGFIKKGIPKSRLKAKVFGGGKVLAQSLPAGGSRHVGEKNVDFVLDYLKMENIPIVARDLGGEGGRKIYFFPWTGKVLVSRLRQTVEVISLETAYKKVLAREEEKSRVILFGEEL